MVDLVNVLGSEMIVPVVSVGQTLGVPDKAASHLGRKSFGDVLIEILRCLAAFAACQILFMVRHVANVGR